MTARVSAHPIHDTWVSGVGQTRKHVAGRTWPRHAAPARQIAPAATASADGQQNHERHGDDGDENGCRGHDHDRTTASAAPAGRPRRQPCRRTPAVRGDRARLASRSTAGSGRARYTAPSTCGGDATRPCHEDAPVRAGPAGRSSASPASAGALRRGPTGPDAVAAWVVSSEAGGPAERDDTAVMSASAGERGGAARGGVGRRRGTGIRHPRSCPPAGERPVVRRVVGRTVPAAAVARRERTVRSSSGSITRRSAAAGPPRRPAGTGRPPRPLRRRAPRPRCPSPSRTARRWSSRGR